MLNAKLGPRPSYLWRSFFAVIDLIKDTYYWIVGNGANIRIWGDKWTPIPTSFTFQSSNRILEHNAKVCEFIDSSTGDWNGDLIYQVFTESKAAIICTIPLS